MAETREPGINRRMAADLEALRERNQFRELASPPGIQLSSNDYLGLSSHPGLKDAIARALEEDDRVSSTGSRLLSGNSERWEQLEQRFAEFVGTEAALYFPSGYAANIGLLSSILKDGDTVFSDSANHASLIDGIRLSRANRVIFPHADLGYLEESLRRTRGKGEKIIVVESVFSMDGDRAPLRELITLCERHGATLIVDEAHAIGVEGLGGRGLVHAIREGDHVLATVHTCGKALASMGAFVAGSRTLRDYLINHARTFIFTTALPPYCAAQIQEALSLSITADADRDHLCELSRHLRKRLKEAEFETPRSNSQIIPLILGSNDAAVRFAAAMNAAGFAVRAIRPPSVPAGTSRLRLSLHSKLSFADMDAFTEALVAVRESEVVPE
ncbi:MAG: 8-amino-7-oxononanoate synthase [Acidobacteria bacterium]|nr:MAG: 8-amino-7-oxononanoate synthase [Acidobacteriota bacterium]